MKHLMGAATAAAVLMSTGSALAWHNQGHMMVAEVAWSHLTAGAKCRAVKLLQSDHEFARGLQKPAGIDAGQALFVNAATWPDRIKATGSGFHPDGDDANAVGAQASLNVGLTDKLEHKYWHFVDNPVPEDPNRPPPTVNAEERIRLFTTSLGDQATPTPVKAYDLAWLLHLVGDVHQPLHTATQYGAVFTTPASGTDAGGNDVVVSYPGYHELHGFWDGAPGDSKNNKTVLKTSIDAADSLPAPPPAKAVKMDPHDWVMESHAYAVSDAYVSPVQLQHVDPVTLTDAYAANARQIALQQVALAGARLATLLNTSLAWPDSTCDHVGSASPSSGRHHHGRR